MKIRKSAKILFSTACMLALSMANIASASASTPSRDSQSSITGSETRANTIGLQGKTYSAGQVVPIKTESGNDQLSLEGKISDSTHESHELQFYRSLPGPQGRLTYHYSVAKARAYAEKWATRINPVYGVAKSRNSLRGGSVEFWNGASVDCTNFASQILRAGGAPMSIYNSKYQGWWWKSQNNQSVSWVNANTFVRYMGSGYKTRSWHHLVANVRPGDFIAVDTDGDGVINHIGFVDANSRGRLRIAQHSANYLAWNGNWPTYNGKGMYYRVGR